MNKRDQIALLEWRVSQLEQRVNSLEQREHLCDPAPATAPSPPPQTTYPQMPFPQMPVQPPLTAPIPPLVNPSVNGSSQKTLERKMGTWVMGVLASALIFIGLCFLALLVYPLLNKPMRFAGMLVVSITILLVGILVDRRHRTPFSLSLSACGTGAIYLSILLTRLYFNYINNYLLYALFLAWAVGMTICSHKLKSLVFQIIGYLGIAVSLFAGLFLIGTLGDALFLSIFVAACEAVYFLLDRQKDANYVLLSSMSILFGFTQAIRYLFLWTDQLTDGVSLLLFVITCLFLLAPISFFLCVSKWNRKTGTASNTMFCLLYGSQASIIILLGEFFMLEQDLHIHYGLWLALFVSLLFLCLFEIKRDHPLRRLFSLYTCLVLYLFTALIAFADTTAIIGLFPVFALLFLAGFIRKDLTYLAVGFTAVLINILIVAALPNPLLWKSGILLALSLIGVFLSVIAMLLKPCLQKGIFKILLFSGLLLLLYGFYKNTFSQAPWDYLWMILLPLLALTVCSGYAFRWNHVADILLPRTRMDANTLTTLQIYGEVGLVGALICLYDSANLLTHWVLFLMALLLLVANFWIWYRRKLTKPALQCYVGIRMTAFTLLAIFSFISWQKYAIFGSVIALILAILFILWGFRKRYPALRIYGLILSIVCVLKLMLIDIHYDNGFILIFGFIGSGILCFVISWIYNYIAKKY